MVKFGVLAAAAVAIAAPAAAQQGAGMTIQQIGAAASGAPMNGGVVALRAAPPESSVPFFVGTIPNTDLEFGVGGIDCRPNATGVCRGAGFIFLAGSERGYQQETIDKINDTAPFAKFYRLNDAAVMTVEQTLIGGGAATVRASIENLEAGIAKVIEAIENQTVQVSFADAPAAVAAGEGPSLKLAPPAHVKDALKTDGSAAAIEAVMRSWSPAAE